MRSSHRILALCLLIAPSALVAQDVTLELPDTAADLRATLRTASLTMTLEDEGTESPQDYVAAARADYRRLLTGLYAEGYYGGTISILVDGIEAANLDPLITRSTVSTIVLRVDPGPRFTFGRTDIAPLASGTELPEAFSTGSTARSDTIGDAAGDAVAAWRSNGHALARTSGQSITARHPDRELDVSVAIEPGPELTFGNIAVEGNSAVRTERVLAIAGIPTNGFDPAMIDRAEDNLRRTGAFTSAAVIESDTAVDGTLPVTIAVVEQTPRRIGFGAEYSSVSGLTLSSYWLHRNLLGGAERLRVDGEITGLSGGTGGIDYSLGATFLRPATFRQDTDFYINASAEQLDEPTYFERDISVEAGIIRRIRDDVILEYGLGIEVGEISDDLGDRNYELIYLPIEGTLDRRNDAFDATSGFYANLSITPFVGFNDTDSGARVVGDGRIYRSFGQDDRFTLAARGQLGAIFGADAENVPSSYLFYSGGGGTVRGQSYQSLAVDLGGGDEIGGTAFVGAQLEARVGVTDTIGLVGFYDAGYIGSDPLNLGEGDWHSGAGLGVRYDTGIGPIRLDLATPTSGDDAGKQLEIYIGIGQAF
ncbi:autotransporter assembly complex family protein [Octadecabacter sp. 1_MG-2023]|uniref:autotransporter assembly complex protein TamA n=1 Tax=unclassified Octadecabacter TaxID=196158 RepID=UPI001C0A5A34|nr:MULTISPECIES: autotransporter assembly complex family protein [unclassified Octadecabacter]MBU2994637.1 autotransporter assembly complex protein TamA [Octadecabacter sp. B2R22]MDO6734070.1 autotransporter assembly complex family protein [Octadecabacter sp. 1_MG-2023]